MSVFAELRSIKEFRESQAELGLKKAQAEVTLRRDRHEELQALMEQFREQAREQELQWYADLCSKLVKLKEITEVRDGVAGLRQDEQKREDDTDEAGRAVEKAIESSKAARLALKQATAVKDKFVELATTVAEEAAKE